MKKSTYLLVKHQVQNRKLEGLNFSFCKGISYKDGADAKRRISSFMMYVKESININSSIF